ncbi:MAG TPA: sucrase ferredoxin, partial [Actinomycetota bacterium]
RFVFVQVEPPWPSRVEDDPRVATSPDDAAGTVVRAIWPVVPGPSQERTSFEYARPNGPSERLAGSELGQAIPSEIRDILICTHGTRDACCGTIGMKLVQALSSWAEDQPNVRLWRSSHLGGHRFAPTMVDLPSGDSWAFVDPSVAPGLLEGDHSPQSVLRHHRGWWGLGSAFEQAAETAAWARIGSSWREGTRSGQIAETSDDGNLATVRLEAIDGLGRTTTVRAQVQRSLCPQVVSCGIQRNEAEYRVTRLDVEGRTSIP